MNKNIFIVKLVKDNGMCSHNPGHYLVKATSEWLRDTPTFDIVSEEAAIFSSLKAAEKYIKNNCGVGFTYEIIEFTPHKSTIVKN